MNKLLLKICAVLMIIAVAVSTLTCNKKNNVDETAAFSSEDTISADFPWFENKKINIDYGIDESKPAVFTGVYLAGADDKYIVAVATAYYELLGDNSSVSDSDMQEYEASITPIISVYDRVADQTVNHINVKKDISISSIVIFFHVDDICRLLIRGFAQGHVI